MGVERRMDLGSDGRVTFITGENLRVDGGAVMTSAG